MQKKRSGLYNALVVLPDRLYPFKTYVSGQWVRGIRSYNATLARYERLYGSGRYGFKLEAYRQLFHLFGSVLFLIIAAYLSQVFFEKSEAIYAFLIAAVVLVSFQEFYLHRRMYQQLWKKSVIDWLAWCVPIGLYFWMYLL
jgi:lipopolysaccharide export LptBFGC system permease protein LptF